VIPTVPIAEQNASVGSDERKVVFEARKLERRMSTGDENMAISSFGLDCPRRRVPSCQSTLCWENRRQLQGLVPTAKRRSNDNLGNELNEVLSEDSTTYNDNDAYPNVGLDRSKSSGSLTTAFNDGEMDNVSNSTELVDAPKTKMMDIGEAKVSSPVDKTREDGCRAQAEATSTHEVIVP
jgi:hypothetical protein